MLRSIVAALGLCLGLLAQGAQANPYGVGCYSSRASFYELMPTQGIDLSGSFAAPGGMTLFSVGDSYLGLPLLAPWHNPGPGSQNLLLSDDSIQPVSLGFSMPFPGGQTTTLHVCSNGFLSLTATTSADFSPTVAELLQGTARFALLWADLNPGAGGTVTFETDPSLGVAYVTFTNVPEFANSGLATFQMAFHSFGQVDLLYAACSLNTHPALVGFSPGGGALDPGPTDLSAVGTLLTGPDEDALQLTSQAPRLGTTISINISGRRPGSLGAILAFGAAQYIGGIDLSTIGMPGCRQYASIDQYQLLPGPGSFSSVQVGVPSGSALLGLRVYAQAVASAPQRNQLELTASNGVELVLGL